jgi:hypothetical protein
MTRALVSTISASVAAAVVTWAAPPNVAAPWDPPEAGPYPVDPPYVDDDASVVDAGAPFCDACVTP